VIHLKIELKEKPTMFEKLKRIFKKHKRAQPVAQDKSEHRVHTTKYEDLCQ